MTTVNLESSHADKRDNQHKCLTLESIPWMLAIVELFTSSCEQFF